MLQIRKRDDRYRMQTGWLDARWHLSFDRYYDPENVQFGPLCVFNDDVIDREELAAGDAARRGGMERVRLEGEGRVLLIDLPLVDDAERSLLVGAAEGGSARGLAGC